MVEGLLLLVVIVAVVVVVTTTKSSKDKAQVPQVFVFGPSFETKRFGSSDEYRAARAKALDFWIDGERYIRFPDGHERRWWNDEDEQRHCELLDKLAEDERLRPFREDPLLKWWFDLTVKLENAPASEESAIAREMISRSGAVADLLRKAYPARPLAIHHGFKRLAIDAEKAGNHAEAIVLCERAKIEGWNGDWDKRIERCRNKAAKAAKPRE